MNALRGLWSAISVGVVAVVGFACMGPVGFVAFPVAALTVAALKAHIDAAQLAELRRQAEAARAEAVASQEHYRQTAVKLAEAVARRDRVLAEMRRDGWYVAGEVVSLN